MTALPARPDPDSGEPKPPRAPEVVGPWTGYRRSGRRTESFRPAQAQQWFAEPAPLLELVEGRRRRGLWQVAAYSAGSALLLFGGVAVLAHGDRVLYLVAAVLWAISTATSYLIRRMHTVYAGATWAGDGEDQDKFVTTYDLARIRVFGAGKPSAMLQIIGADGAFLQLPLGLLEGNPALWDLVYNGVRHSVASGAEIDAETRALLHLG
ncbi:hypothetical protein [Pseudonocardia spinosispora]|uniref:hypothetical protein n=1 Tax=Pseudonocardia spinosispora TaxID=103441 RepID=UPI0004155112|nr:hypothetical protein [Pseudonocardia spinosispora]